MRNQYHCNILCCEIPNYVLNLRHQLRVESGSDLVKQQDLRFHRQRPGNRYALLLATRQLSGERIKPFGQSNPGKEFAPSLLGLLPLEPFARSADRDKHSPGQSYAGNKLYC